MTSVQQRVKQSNFSKWLPKSDTNWGPLKKGKRVMVFENRGSAQAHIEKMKTQDRTYLPEDLFEYRITEVK